MMDGCRNIYKSARKTTDFTQEEAAERLYIGTRTLGSYETGTTVPPDDVVCRMSEIYNTPWLAYEHLKNSSAVGQKYLPDLNFSDMAKAVLKFKKEVKDLTKIDDEMVDIACDGIVDDEETDRWAKVEKEIADVMAAALNIILCQQKEKSA